MGAFDKYLPAQMGVLDHLSTQRLISDVLGQIAYEVRGKEVWFNKDLPALSPSVTSVSVQLIVADFSKFDEHELLPIDAQLQGQIVAEVVKMFAVEPQNEPTDPTKK